MLGYIKMRDEGMRGNRGGGSEGGKEGARGQRRNYGNECRDIWESVLSDYVKLTLIVSSNGQHLSSIVKYYD